MSAETDRPAKWPTARRGGFLSQADFCDEQGLIPELTPFECRRIGPWETVEFLYEQLDAMPTTASTFRLKELTDGTDYSGTDFNPATVNDGLLLLGAWPENQSRQLPIRWVNPHYSHERALAPADVESREAHLRACANVAVHGLDDLAPRFDLSEGGLSWWVNTHEVPWAEWRAEGRKRLARTIRTTAEWHGESIKSVCEVVPGNYNRLKRWVTEYAPKHEWDVPDDPARVGGFDS